MYKLLLFVSLFFICCSNDPNEQILRTTERTLEAIRVKDYTQFKRLCAVDFIGSSLKTEEMIKNDVDRMHSLLVEKKSVNEGIILTNKYNEIGQRLVEINGADIIVDGQKMHFDIEFYFGPSEIHPYSKISGYDIVNERFKSNEFR